MSYLEQFLESLALRKDVLNIVQVGANDGRINDPIYDFVMSNKKRTRLLLIEPQPELIPILQQNYKGHPCAVIFNGAIGPLATFALFRVKPELWRYYDPPYMKEAPAYRVPSGLASGSRQHIMDHAGGNLPRALPIEDCLEELQVPSRRLIELECDFPQLRDIDLLQIDTEGLDDVTVRSCNIDILAPKLINYEFCHLGTERHEKLKDYLVDHNYRLFQWNASDVLAVSALFE